MGKGKGKVSEHEFVDIETGKEIDYIYGQEPSLEWSVKLVTKTSLKLHFWTDLKPPYKSIGFGWLMFVWCFDEFDHCFEVVFLPTDKTIFEWSKKDDNGL